MVICSLDTLKKSSKKKKTRIKKEIVELLQQASYHSKRLGWWNSWLWPCICWVEEPFSAITGCFQKVNYQGFDVDISNSELPPSFLFASFELFEKQAILFGNKSVLLKIRDSLLCVGKCCIKIMGKQILSTVSRFKIWPPYKSRVKLICI